MSEKMFRFTVQNMTTKERTQFIGQGETMADALKDGVKNAQSALRPGRAGAGDMKFAVKTESGHLVNRSVSEFESDVPAPFTEIEHVRAGKGTLATDVGDKITTDSK